jgi:prepilin-type N-terminal cleavage/methylation domain-containing protein/prepilin-type processing-associated H-X9-DG protein
MALMHDVRRLRKPLLSSTTPGQQTRHREAGLAALPGFTLIEVLVVVAIIALIISILIPALKQAREQASGAVCMSNMRQLMLGMTSYMTEAGRFPGTNAVFETARARDNPSGPYWEPRDSWLGMRWAPKSWDTNEQDLLWQFVDETVPKLGSLYKRYIRNEQVYLCSKDKRGLPDPNDPAGGGGNGRFSYTVNGVIGFKTPEELQSFTYVVDFTTMDGALPAKYKTIPAGTRVRWASSDMPVLIEEHPWNNTNHGRPTDGWAPDSYLAFRHYPRKRNGRTPFAFLDGHVQLRMYTYRFDPSRTDPGGAALLGVDLFNEFRFPYSWGNAGGEVNADAFTHKFPYPY